MHFSNTYVFRILRLGDGPIVPFLLNARRPTHNLFGCDLDLGSSTFPRFGCVFVQGIKMSSSGSQNQSRASQGKSPTLVQLRRRVSKSSREPGGNQTNARTGTFSRSTQVGFKSPLRDVSSSVSALKTGLGRISSTPIFRNIFSSVRTSNQPPPPGQSDSLTDDVCSSVTDTLVLPETPLMDTGGPFDIHQWDPLDTNLLALLTSGTEASPGL